MNTTKTKSKTCLQRTKSTYLHLAFCDPSNDKAQFLNPYLPLSGTSSLVVDQNHLGDLMRSIDS